MPVVLFLCTHNAGRSQMALGFFTHLAADAYTPWANRGLTGTICSIAVISEGDVVLFRQYYLDCRPQASYVIGDEDSGQAVVVDPRRDVAE